MYNITTLKPGKGRQSGRIHVRKIWIYACGFGFCPLLEVILYRLLSFGGTLAVRCPEYRGVRYSEVLKLMYYFYRKSNRGMEFVRCTEVVRLLESPLLEVSLYCPLST